MAPCACRKSSLKFVAGERPGAALHAATTQARKTKFHLVSKRTDHRLKLQMVDGETGRAVDDDQVWFRCGASIRGPQAIADARLGQDELRPLRIGLDLLPELAHIDPQVLRIGHLVP
jgi:hypothetical protein